MIRRNTARVVQLPPWPFLCVQDVLLSSIQPPRHTLVANSPR
jgi:hypothetical protein